jgi:hypothetical protein
LPHSNGSPVGSGFSRHTVPHSAVLLLSFSISQSEIGIWQRLPKWQCELFSTRLIAQPNLGNDSNSLLLSVVGLTSLFGVSLFLARRVFPAPAQSTLSKIPRLLQEHMTPHHSVAQFLNVTAATAVPGNEQSVEDEPVGRRRSKGCRGPVCGSPTQSGVATSL